MRRQLNQSYLCKITNSRISLVDEQFESWFNSKYFKAEGKKVRWRWYMLQSYNWKLIHKKCKYFLYLI